jgi:hypothetical protein
VEIAGRQVYIEERRPNSNIPSRGGSKSLLSLLLLLILDFFTSVKID